MAEESRPPGRRMRSSSAAQELRRRTAAQGSPPPRPGLRARAMKGPAAHCDAGPRLPTCRRSSRTYPSQSNGRAAALRDRCSWFFRNCCRFPRAGQGSFSIGCGILRGRGRRVWGISGRQRQGVRRATRGELNARCRRQGGERRYRALLADCVNTGIFWPAIEPESATSSACSYRSTLCCRSTNSRATGGNRPFTASS